MGTSTAKPTGYISGEDPATLEANRVYQDALARLSQSLDTRKNRFFDPILLAAAQGFGAPTQTGSFGESLGNVAKNVSAAQAEDIKLEQAINEQRVAAAGKGIELQRMRKRDAEFANWLQDNDPTGPPPKGLLSPTVVAGPGAGAVAGPRAVTLPKVGEPYQRLSLDQNPERRENLPAFNTYETRYVTQAELDKIKNQNSAGPLTSLDKVFDPRAPSVPEVPTAATGLGGPKAGSLPAPDSVANNLQGALTRINSNKPPGYEGVEGVPISPPNRNFVTGRDYVRLNRHDTTKSFGEIIKEAQEIEQKRYRDKDNGVLDLATGLYYQYPTGKTEEITISGYPGTYKVDARVAAKLSSLAFNNDPAYHDYAKRVIEGPPKKSDAKTGDGEPSGGLKSVQQLVIEAEEAKTRAGKLGEAGAAKEAALEETDATARRIYGSATRIADYLKASPNYFGIFARPGVTAAIGNLIKEGIQTPTGTLNLAGFEDSMRKLMPGVTQADLDNVTKAAAELAEIELAFTRLYLAKQGAVTEGERKIVRAIPGTTSSSPEVLRSRMDLLRARSQFDIDVVDAFRKWQENNTGRSYLEFERKSDLYKDIKKGFEAETEKIFGGIKAVPTSQRKQEAAPSPAGTPSPGFILGADGVIRRKKAGE